MNKSVNYYPFGMGMPGRTWTVASGGEYRFEFNGQEQDDEVYGDQNLNTAEFWEYDVRLGRRWNLDPKPSASIGRYVAFADNPISYTDVLGDKVTGDLVSYNQVKDYVINSISSIDNNINNVKTKMANREALGKGTKHLDKKLQALETQRSSYQSVLDEFTSLEQSSQVYNIVTGANPSGLPKGAGGVTEFNKNTGYVDVIVGTNMPLLESLPHELKHAYQFETRTTSLGWNGGGGALYDLQDEVEAYRRSKLFGFYAGEEIDAEWVIRRGYDASLSHTQIAWDTPSATYPGAPTYGEQVGSSISRSAMHFLDPKEVVKDWWIYEQTGYDILEYKLSRL